MKCIQIAVNLPSVSQYTVEWDVGIGEIFGTSLGGYKRNFLTKSGDCHQLGSGFAVLRKIT